MKKENKVIAFIKMIFRCFSKKDKEEEKRHSDEAKRRMCMRAVQSGICPNACEICAWNVKE